MKSILKILLASIFLIFPACDDIKDKLYELKPRFKFGDTVAVTDGFYSGCHGRVTSYRIWGRDVVYDVDMWCDSNDAKFGRSHDGEYKESDLVEDSVNR